MKLPCLLLALWLPVGVVWAQEVPLRTQQQLEVLAEALEADPEDDQWLQQLEEFRKHPLSINKATAEELRSLRLLTDLQVWNLLQYRQKLGALVDVYELQAVPGWDVSLIQRLLPFITVREDLVVRETLRRRLKEGSHNFLLSMARVLETQKGYRALSANRYLGSPDHVQFRYQYRHKNLLQYGLAGDKDAGEPILRGAQRGGFDFYSFHLFARKLGAVKALALGDYTANLGQGLIQWQALAFAKSAEVINIKRQADVLLPYSSAGEFYFNRGAGLTLQKGKMEATVFASYRKLSGNYTQDSVNGAEAVTSIQPSGYHRTEAEMEDRNRVEQMVVGGNLALKQARYSVGVNAVHTHLSIPLKKRDEPYNRYSIRGKDWANYSLDYGVTYKNAHFYGEAAVDGQFHKAFIQGLLASVHAKVDVSLLYRNIEPGYQSFSGRSFTENAMPTNEQGFYTGITIRPSPLYKIDAYADFYRFPWLKYRVDAPSAGRDYSVQLTYQPRKGLEVAFRHRNEQKSLNVLGPDTVQYVLRPQLRQNWRLHMAYQLNRVFELRARTELVRFSLEGGGKENGFSAFLEGVCRQSAKLSANLRLQYFSTDGYNSRIYAYESDILYHFYIPATFYRGARYYLRVNLDAGKKVSFWLKWAQTFFKNLKTIGSGLDEIEGSNRSEIKAQMLFVL